MATPGLGYAILGSALTDVGVGIGPVFSHGRQRGHDIRPAQEIGVASGTNSAPRELGDVFGVAVLAPVFARRLHYTSHLHRRLPGRPVGRRRLLRRR